MPVVHEHQLSNGMTILCFPQDHLHSLDFGLYLRGGSLFETRANQGITHLVEHLCFRNLGGLDSLGLNAVLDSMGTELEGGTYPEALVFTMKTHPRFFDKSADLFMRFFDDTPWTQKDIDGARRVVLRQIEQDEEGFDDTVDRRWRRTAEGAFPVMGTVQSVESLSAVEIHQFRRMLFQPQNACLCMTGNFSSAMEDALCQIFAELKNTTDEPPFVQMAPLSFCVRDERSDMIIDEPGGQARVILSFDMDEDLVYPLIGDVLNAITGADNDSLLFQSLREEEGYLAEIDSSIEELGMFRRLVIRYAVRQEELETSLRKVFSLLHRLSLYVRPIRMDETRMQFTQNRLFALDDAAGMNEIIGWSWIAEDLSRSDLEARALMYGDLTTEDILNAAQSVFRPENLVISVSRDPQGGSRNLRSVLNECRAMLG